MHSLYLEQNVARLTRDLAKKNRTGQAEFGSNKVWPLVFSSAIKQRKNSGRGAVAQLVERPSKGPGS